MIDPFVVLLAPVLLLAVVALLRFVGCFIKPARPGVTLVTVTFSGPEPTTPTFSPPEVPYKNLDFDANWAWERNTPENNLNHVFFQSGLTSGSFAFHDGPKFLKRLNVSAGPPAGTITVSDPNNSQNLPVSMPIPVTTGQSVNVPIDWQNTSTTVTVSFTSADSMGIDTIVYAL